MQRSRRTVLTCVGDGVVASASCTEGGSQSTTTDGTSPTTVDDASHLGDFVVWNDDDTRHGVTLRVRRGSESIADVTRTFDPDESVEVANPISTQGTYEVVAETEDGRSASREWVIDSCHSVEFVRVRVTNEGLDIEFGRETIVPTPTCAGGGS